MILRASRELVLLATFNFKGVWSWKAGGNVRSLVDGSKSGRAVNHGNTLTSIPQLGLTIASLIALQLWLCCCEVTLDATLRWENLDKPPPTGPQASSVRPQQTRLATATLGPRGQPRDERLPIAQQRIRFLDEFSSSCPWLETLRCLNHESHTQHASL